MYFSGAEVESSVSKHGLQLFEIYAKGQHIIVSKYPFFPQLFKPHLNEIKTFFRFHSHIQKIADKVWTELKDKHNCVEDCKLISIHMRLSDYPWLLDLLWKQKPITKTNYLPKAIQYFRTFYPVGTVYTTTFFL